MRFIECVAERDVDLLILEELHVSASFRSWLLAEVFGPDVGAGQFLGAWHSVSHVTLGESDLVIVFKDGQAITTALLIENKIDAPPEPEQAARYRLRGKVGINEGKWKAFRTCIIAPQKYLAGTANASEYDARLSYESIRGWFGQSAPADHRSAYKARMLDEAIEQNRRGYSPTPHPGVTQFWLDYWHLVNAEFPQLRMKKPGQVPAGSDWPEFRNPELGPSRVIVHKLASGVVDLQIASAGDNAEEIAVRNQDVLQGAFEVVRAGKSAAVRATVPKVDRFGDLPSQLEAVRAGLSAASRLLTVSARVNAG
ncbi:MAG: hypothetical protein FJ303_23735 [Planctomycetes bacterium]|nr:hypothetical protein [Planctomycetota bacterium]